MSRKFVLDATLEGFRAAIPAQLAHYFSWESADVGPALLFLGTGLRSTQLSQDTWFQFVDGHDAVRYAIRISNIDSDSPCYGTASGELLAILTLDEAADFLEMCIEQAMGDLALIAMAQRQATAKRRDD